VGKFGIITENGSTVFVWILDGNTDRTISWEKWNKLMRITRMEGVIIDTNY